MYTRASTNWKPFFYVCVYFEDRKMFEDSESTKKIKSRDNDSVNR